MAFSTAVIILSYCYVMQLLRNTVLKKDKKVMTRLATQPQISVLYVRYADIIAAPEEQAENIASFLDTEMDTAAMAAAVNKSLYRNRN